MRRWTTSGPAAQYATSQVEVEFDVDRRADAQARAGGRLWTVGAESEAGLSGARTHRVSLMSTARISAGGDLLVNGSPDRPSGPGDVSVRIAD
ncbi:trypco2 family protein [Streptomyces sp. NPDC006879]|uniref:trypco2 family protein n=1 Tax=Streptomyces sp. NPDC006879 TaxID=3364767 RepID=UPI0036ADE445